jgi:hypothetical protein
MNEALRAIAYYEEVERLPDPTAKPLRLATSTRARTVCVQSFTHELHVQWAIIDGRRPAVARLEIAYPDGHVEQVELKPIEREQAFPMTYPKGGRVIVSAFGTDEGNGRASTQTSVELPPCPG